MNSHNMVSFRIRLDRVPVTDVILYWLFLVAEDQSQLIHSSIKGVPTLVEQ